MAFCIYCGEKAAVTDMFCRRCGRTIPDRPALSSLARSIDYAMNGRRDVQRKLLLIGGSMSAFLLCLLAVYSALILHPIQPAVTFQIPPAGYFLLPVLAVAILSSFLLYKRPVQSMEKMNSQQENATAPGRISLTPVKKIPQLEKEIPETINTNQTPTRATPNENDVLAYIGEPDLTSSKDKPSDLQNALQGLDSIHHSGILRYKEMAGRGKLIFGVSIALLLIGVITLMESVVASSTVLTFIGLGLTFWGLLFMYVRPTRYARAELVDSTALSSIQVIDRMAYELGYNGKGIYVPTKGNEPIRVFIPAQKDTMAIPHPDKIKDGVFYTEPKGIAILPPGLELAKFFREQIGKADKPITLKQLEEQLPTLLTDRLEIMEDFEISDDGNTVRTRSTGSVYSNFCDEIRLKTRVCTAFGCPLCSAIACLIVDATGSPVILEEDESKQNGYIIESTYRLLPTKSQIKNVLGVEPIASD